MRQVTANLSQLFLTAALAFAGPGIEDEKANPGERAADPACAVDEE